MSAVAPFDCAVCGRRIGKRTTHIVTETDVVCCIRCVFDRSKAAHAVAYPDCPMAWHDMYDHQHSHATRAGARWVASQGGFHAVFKDRTRLDSETDQ